MTYAIHKNINSSCFCWERERGFQTNHFFSKRSLLILHLLNRFIKPWEFYYRIFWGFVACFSPQVSSSGIEKIATGANPKDLTLMKLCCDAVKPATCCDNKLSEWKEGNNSTDYSNSDKEGFCAKVSSCVMKEYISETQPMQDCLDTPWHFKNMTEEVVIKTLNCSALGGKSSETGRQSMELDVYWWINVEFVITQNVECCMQSLWYSYVLKHMKTLKKK